MLKLFEGFYRSEHLGRDFTFTFAADPSDDLDSAFKRAIQEEYDEDVEPAPNEYDICGVTFVKDYKTGKLYRVNLEETKN